MTVRITAGVLALLLASSAGAAMWPRNPDARAGAEVPRGFATHGDWDVQARPGGFLWASTQGERGSFGQFCNATAAACAWVLVLRGVTCHKGDEHPVLVNTERAASHHRIQCLGELSGSGAALAFTDFDRIDDIVRSGRRIGIAIPGSDDNIAVAHFALRGAAATIDEMRKQVETAAAPASAVDLDEE